MSTQLRYAYRVTPTAAQRQALARAFGCARVVYNDAIACREAAYLSGSRFPTDAELSRALTVAKKTPERAWLASVSAVVLQQALADANAAYRNFFKSGRGGRRGPRVGAPRFRSKRDRTQSVRFSKAARFRVLPNGKLRLPGIGDVPVRWSRPLPAEPSSVTLILDPAGRYRCSFVVAVPAATAPHVTQEVGIDLGLTHFAALSSSQKIAAPKFGRKAAAKLRRAQKELARRQKGSANREKSRRRVARCHAQVADTRRDWLHKLSTTIVQENQLIAVEDLAVSGMARARLARSVNDAGWATFVAMLSYKAQRAGRTFTKVDRWFPSTRMCSSCGRIGDKLPLNVRQWRCLCGVVHDRDVNAAKNILAAGRADRSTPVELVSVVPQGAQPAVKQEPAGGVVRTTGPESCQKWQGGRQRPADSPIGD